jgi:predicted CXXCH cytochrome family protein
MKLFTIIWGLLFFSLFAALVTYCLGPDPHDFAPSECILCHTGSPDSPEFLNVRSSSLTCKPCHQDVFESGYIHPVDIIPENVTVPRDMPLSRTGLLTCDTCHDIHADYQKFPNFLRRQESPHIFCLICHSDDSMGESHASTLAEAHFTANHIASESGMTGTIDPLSKNCLGCHDSTQGSSVSLSKGRWNHGSNFPGPTLGQQHPIGIHYEQARMRPGRKTDLRPIDEVDKRINFFDGQVGCGSCHNPYSQGQDQLVMSDRGSALCFACHMLD